MKNFASTFKTTIAPHTTDLRETTVTLFNPVSEQIHGAEKLNWENNEIT